MSVPSPKVLTPMIDQIDAVATFIREVAVQTIQVMLTMPETEPGPWAGVEAALSSSGTVTFCRSNGYPLLPLAEALIPAP